jgi:hypothetical protein
MANTLHAYVNASVYVFLRVKNVSDEIFEEEQNPHFMSGAFSSVRLLTLCIHFGI